jgi:hypothetical protein
MPKYGGQKPERSAFGTGQGPHSEQITVTHRPQIRALERQQSLCAPRYRDELDFHIAVRMDFGPWEARGRNFREASDDSQRSHLTEDPSMYQKPHGKQFTLGDDEWPIAVTHSCMSGRRKTDGLPWIGEDRLIPLKAVA